MSTITKSEAFNKCGWIEHILKMLLNDIKDKKNRAFFGGHLPKSGMRPRLVLDGSNEGFDFHTIKMRDYCNDIGKVCGYVIDKEETENVTKVKGKLQHVKELALELRHEAEMREYNRFGNMCQTLADIVQDMENNLNDDTSHFNGGTNIVIPVCENESNNNPDCNQETGHEGQGNNDVLGLEVGGHQEENDDIILIGVSDEILQKFGNKATYKTFVKKNEGKKPYIIAKEFMNIVKQKNIKINHGDWSQLIVPHFRKIGLITIGYSSFLKHIRKYERD